MLNVFLSGGLAFPLGGTLAGISWGICLALHQWHPDVVLLISVVPHPDKAHPWRPVWARAVATRTFCVSFGMRLAALLLR